MGALGGKAPPIRGVGFDLDGTVYANYKLNARLIPFAVKETRFLRAFGKTRRELHARAKAGEAAAEPGRAFYRVQAALLAGILNQKKPGSAEPAAVEEKIAQNMYGAWEEQFARFKGFKGVRETIESFRAAGLKTGLLSDFPPRRKLELLGLLGEPRLFDVILCTEELGALKPHPMPFRKLAEDMGLKPEEMLFVGNSPAYDVMGASAAGMSTALIRRGFLSTGPYKGEGVKRAGFVFSNYRQLQKYVLG